MDMLYLAFKGLQAVFYIAVVIYILKHWNEG